MPHHDKSWFLMCRRDLDDLREQAMLALSDSPPLPDVVIDYVTALEKAFLTHEFASRRDSSSAMWDRLRPEEHR